MTVSKPYRRITLGHNSSRILAAYLFPILFAFVTTQADQINESLGDSTLTQVFHDKPEELKRLETSISKRDPYNYVIMAIGDWRMRNEVWGMPILQMRDSALVRPNFQIIENYLNDPHRFFSIDFGGKTSGIISIYRLTDGPSINFNLHYFDTTLITDARKTHQNYMMLASTLFPTSSKNNRRKYGNNKDKRMASLIAFKEFKSSGTSINDSDEIEVIDVQIINPSGSNMTYNFSVFRYYEQREDNLQMHYSTLFYPLNEFDINMIFKKHTQSDANHYMGPCTYFFLDVVDYDSDGVDEFLFIESGYEHNDVILYELKNNKLIEIYHTATSMS